MSDTSAIEWCDATWNWVMGCTKVSPACVNCYAEVSTPSRTMGIEWGDQAERRVARNATFNAPLKWNKKPWVCDRCGWFTNDIDNAHVCIGTGPGGFHRRRVFSLSLGDWLDNKIPVSVLARALNIVRLCPNLNFLLLTKRPQLFFSRMSNVAIYRDIAGKPVIDVDWVNAWACRNEPPPNVWIGTSVEDKQRADERIPELLKIPAKVRFLSCEPLLGPIRLPLTKPKPLYDAEYGDQHEYAEVPNGIDWVIVGGESGPKARPCNIGWVRDIKNQCKAASVPVFVKQLGSIPIIFGVDGPDGCDKLMVCRVSHTKGGNSSEWPEDLRAQEFPNAA